MLLFFLRLLKLDSLTSNILHKLIFDLHHFLELGLSFAFCQHFDQVDLCLLNFALSADTVQQTVRLLAVDLKLGSSIDRLYILYSLAGDNCRLQSMSDFHERQLIVVLEAHV